MPVRGEQAVLTPLDIQKVEFRRVLRGYSEQEVDSFLDRVIQDYENLFRENQDLKEQLTQAEQSASRYREIEDVLKNTMVMAQKNADELRQNTEKEAGLLMDRTRIEAGKLAREAEQEVAAILQEAEQRADEMISEAQKKVKLAAEEHYRLQRETQVFRMRLRSFLEAQIKFLDGEEVGDQAPENLDEEPA